MRRFFRTGSPSPATVFAWQAAILNLLRKISTDPTAKNELLVLSLITVRRLESRLTRRLERLRHVAQTFLSAGCGDYPVPTPTIRWKGTRIDARCPSGLQLLLLDGTLPA